MLRSTTVRRGLGWLMGFVLVASLATWWATRDRLPERVRIATALPGGQYHRLGELIAERLEAAHGLEVELVTSAGSVENRELLLDGRAELALMQAAWKVETGAEDRGIYASLAKNAAAEAALFCANEGLHLHGGYGFMSEYEISKLARDAHIIDIYEGVREVQDMIIGREIV